MSTTTVYAIQDNGDIREVGHSRVAPAGAFIIWEEVERVTGMSLRRDEDAFWKLYNSGRLEPGLNALLGFTYDHAWVSTANIEALIALLRDFHQRVVVPRGIAPTLLNISNILDTLPLGGVRGVCFQQTSVSENPWWVYEQGEDEGEEKDDGEGEDVEEDEGRPYNFDRDTRHFEVTFPPAPA